MLRHAQISRGYVFVGQPRRIYPPFSFYGRGRRGNSTGYLDTAVAGCAHLSGSEILGGDRPVSFQSGTAAENRWLKLVAANRHPLREPLSDDVLPAVGR